MATAGSSWSDGCVTMLTEREFYQTPLHNARHNSHVCRAVIMRTRPPPQLKVEINRRGRLPPRMSAACLGYHNLHEQKAKKRYRNRAVTEEKTAHSNGKNPTINMPIFNILFLRLSASHRKLYNLIRCNQINQLIKFMVAQENASPLWPPQTIWPTI